MDRGMSERRFWRSVRLINGNAGKRSRGLVTVTGKGVDIGDERAGGFLSLAENNRATVS